MKMIIIMKWLLCLLVIRVFILFILGVGRRGLIRNYFEYIHRTWAKYPPLYVEGVKIIIIENNRILLRV